MKSMFGIELNDIQYAELEYVVECVNRGEDTRQKILDRTGSDAALISVYRDLNEKGLVDGIAVWGGSFLFHELTSTGMRFIPELDALEKRRAMKEKRSTRSIWIDRVFGYIAGIVTTVVAALILRYIFGIM